MQRLQQRVAASEITTERAVARKHLKSGDDSATLGVLDTAFALQKKDALGRLDYGPDVSLSSAYTRTAELLQQRLSLALLKKASQIRLPPKQHKLVLRYEEMKRALQKRQDDGLNELQTALQANDRKQVQASLRRLSKTPTNPRSAYRYVLFVTIIKTPKPRFLFVALVPRRDRASLRPNAQAWYRRLVGKKRLPSVSLSQSNHQSRTARH